MSIERCFVGATLVVVAACTSSRTPTMSTPVAAPSASIPSRTVYGVVLDGSQPVQGAQIENGYSPGSAVFSDSNGAFQLSTETSSAPHAWVHATKSGYAQPCAVPILTTGSVAVQLVSLAALNSAPVPSPAGFRTITGLVMMTTDFGSLPAADALVDFEPANDGWPAAMSHTDNSGRFALCSLPETAVQIGVLVGNTFAHVTVSPGEMDIELILDPGGVEGRHR